MISFNTSDLELYKAALKALDRLNPKMLASGGHYEKTRQGCVPCAMGALLASQFPATKRIPQSEMAKVIDEMYPRVQTDSRGIIAVNEDFHNGENSKAKMEARFRHVHAWLTNKITNAT